MTERQAKQIRKLFVLTWFFMLVIVLLLLFLYVADGRPGPQGPTGAQGSQGPAAVVDYERIDAIVTEKVAAEVEKIPVPKNGKDGYTPVKGVDYDDGYTPIKGVDYDDGEHGTNGVNGADPMLQCNETLRMLEWKLSTEDLWTILPVRCGVE